MINRFSNISPIKNKKESNQKNNISSDSKSKDEA